MYSLMCRSPEMGTSRDDDDADARDVAYDD